MGRRQGAISEIRLHVLSPRAQLLQWPAVGQTHAGFRSQPSSKADVNVVVVAVVVVAFADFRWSMIGMRNFR